LRGWRFQVKRSTKLHEGEAFSIVFVKEFEHFDVGEKTAWPQSGQMFIAQLAGVSPLAPEERNVPLTKAIFRSSGASESFEALVL